MMQDRLNRVRKRQRRTTGKDRADIFDAMLDAVVDLTDETWPAVAEFLEETGRRAHIYDLRLLRSCLALPEARVRDTAARMPILGLLGERRGDLAFEAGRLARHRRTFAATSDNEPCPGYVQWTAALLRSHSEREDEIPTTGLEDLALLAASGRLRLLAAELLTGRGEQDWIGCTEGRSLEEDQARFLATFHDDRRAVLLSRLAGPRVRDAWRSWYDRDRFLYYLLGFHELPWVRPAAARALEILGDPGWPEILRGNAADGDRTLGASDRAEAALPLLWQLGTDQPGRVGTSRAFAELAGRDPDGIAGGLVRASIEGRDIRAEFEDEAALARHVHDADWSSWGPWAPEVRWWCGHVPSEGHRGMSRRGLESRYPAGGPRPTEKQARIDELLRPSLRIPPARPEPGPEFWSSRNISWGQRAHVDLCGRCLDSIRAEELNRKAEREDLFMWGPKIRRKYWG